MFALRRRLVLTGVGVFMTLLVLCVSSQSLELNNTGPSKDALCKEFLADKEVQGQMTSLRDKATPCPCQEKIISTDYTFRQTGSENLNNTGTGSCYQEWFPNEDGVKQMCCYRMDGTLRTGSNNGGYIVPNNTPYNITDVHSNCCHGDHVLCEQFYEMIPSDDCSRYTTPVSARSYGDPTITTLDGHSYSFNGHGEYVFLKTNDTEIQARTEYVTEGNKDATMFTAFVFHINKKNISLEAHLNRSTEAIQVYNNGTLLCNSSKTPKGPCTASIGGCLMILAGDNTIGIVDVRGCGFRTFTKSIILTAGEMMDITFDGLKTEKLDNTTQGLAGVTANDNYISRNDSKTSVNASASDIFDFGETWALRNRSESLFGYSLPDGHSYSFYNSNHTRPRFLEELVGNLTALFENFTEANITKFDATCRNYWDNETNTECLLAIASNNDYNFGLNVMKTANETRRQYEITHNTAPYFYKNMSDISVIDVIPNSNKTSITIDLSEYASDNESKSGLRFIIDSEIPTSDYSISAEGVFNWNFTDELRNITLTKLKINVYDTYNKSAQYYMFVRYCGCEHGMAECTDFPEADTNTTNYILTATCNCEKGYEGFYCENRTNPCSITKCYEDRCNSSASVGENPCLPCPHGYEGDGTTCSDIDECDPSYEEIDKCDQMCNNTEGSFNCSCKIGYRLNNDNHTCDDIDECKEGTKICSEIHHEVCVNNIGNAVCNCMPNYMRKTENGSCETIGDAAVFVFTITFEIKITKYTDDINKTVDTVENRKQMEETLNKRFKGTDGYLGVKVFKLSVVITNSPTGRKKREVESGKLDVDYLVQWRNISYGAENVFKDLKDSSSRYNHTTEENQFRLADVVTLDLNTIRLEPNNGTEKGVCQVPEMSDCDTMSTTCNNTEGGFECVCKPGFIDVKLSTKYCADFDECTNSTYQCLGEGYCINNVGTWSCGCNKTDYQPYRMNDSAIRCMGDFQYTGEMNITTLKILTNSSLKDLFNTTIHNALKNKTNTVNVSSSNTSVQMSDIFLFSEIVFGSINPRDSIPHVHFTTLKFIIHTGEPVLFSKMNLTYSGNTSFSNNTSIFGMDIALFSEDDFNLCNITGKTKCHLDTTYCRVKDGSYRCDCKEGFKNTTDPYTCDNIDECNDSTYKCINGSTCIDSIGNWSCACPTGYIEDRINSTVIGCADINECNNTQYSCDGPTDTSATCHNTIGSWNCNCSQGFRLSNKWKYRQRCEDIDECKKNPCKDGGTCSNFPGGFNCSCLQGYDLKNSTNGTYSCEDINECNAPNACIRSLSCSNIPGDWLCTCSEGLEEMQINSSSKMCGGGYEYVAEIRFNLVNIITSIEKFNTNFENKLQSLYKEAYEGKLIQIEIISTRVLSSSNRFRTTLTPYVTKYIIQYVEKMNQTDLQKMENYYLPKKTCNYNVCGFQNISDTTVQFVNFTVLNNSAICETPRNVCNKDKSTCVSNDGLLDCKCNKGFMKTSNYSLFCEDFNECNDKRYLCNGTSSVCRNSVGAWSCDCKAGYTPIIKSDYHIVCKGNTYSYPFSISLTICGPDPKNDTAIKLSIQQQLEQKYMTLLNDSDVWVEILKIVKVTSERRDINIENKVNVTYIVHTANTTTAAIFKNAAKFNLTIPCCNAPCEVSPASIDNSVLCSKCDSNSTNCSTTNNELRCDCKDGFDSKNGTSCKDIDECFSSNYICNGTCTNTVGSWNCTCKAGYKTVSKSNTAVECHDPCEKSKCHEQSLCVRFDNVDGYKCGCTHGRSGIYCETVNTTSTSTSTSDKTIFIAAGSTLGGVIAILVIVVIIVCRWRAAKIKEAEKIAMDHLENSRVIAFDNEYLADQYLPNGRNGSINSERVSNGFVRNGSLQNGTRHSYDDRNGPNYSKPVKPPKPRYHNTLADAADASRSRDSSQPFSYNVYNPPGLMRSGNQLDNRGNPNNGRSSPIPDYDAPRSPRPDYGHRDASYDSKDSGVGNGYHGNGYSIDTDFYRGKRIPSAARTERGLSTNF